MGLGVEALGCGAWGMIWLEKMTKDFDNWGLGILRAVKAIGLTSAEVIFSVADIFFSIADIFFSVAFVVLLFLWFWGVRVDGVLGV